jgi:hypothetical protein
VSELSHAHFVWEHIDERDRDSSETLFFSGGRLALEPLLLLYCSVSSIGLACKRLKVATRCTSSGYFWLLLPATAHSERAAES